TASLPDSSFHEPDPRGLQQLPASAPKSQSYLSQFGLSYPSLSPSSCSVPASVLVQPQSSSCPSTQFLPVLSQSQFMSSSASVRLNTVSSNSESGQLVMRSPSL